MTKTKKSNLITVTMAIGILSIGVIIGFSAYPQPAEAGPAVIAVVTTLIANLLTTVLGQFAEAELLQTQINAKANAIFGLETDGDFGLAAIDTEVEQNTALLTNGDFGLEAIDDEVEVLLFNVLHPDWGLEEIDDEVEHNTALLEDPDFGLDAQTNDPIYGLKRLAFDIQHFDWGLEVIDDEIEVLDAKISKQLAKQRVEISLTKTNSDYFLQTSESGKPVDVEFITLTLIQKGVTKPLIEGETIIITQIETGLYLLEIKTKGPFDGIYIILQHLEDPIMHASLPEPIPVDHFGAILVEPTVVSSGTQ